MHQRQTAQFIHPAFKWGLIFANRFRKWNCSQNAPRSRNSLMMQVGTKQIPSKRQRAIPKLKVLMFGNSEIMMGSIGKPQANHNHHSCISWHRFSCNTNPLAHVFHPALASKTCLTQGSFGLCFSEGTVTTQWEDKQAIISCFCYWARVISSDSDIWLELSFSYTSLLLCFYW